jgi:hypothetical protein
MTRLRALAVVLTCAGALLCGAVAARAGQLSAGGGPVMRAPVVLHPVYWQPAGSKLSFPAAYRRLVDGFIANVAAASGSAANPFGLLGQYGTPYRLVAGPPILDTDPLPRSDCVNPTHRAGGSGWPVCLRERSLIRELTHVVRARRLPRGLGDLYYLITPRGLGDCQGPGPENCAVGGYQNAGYCGYHDSFGSPPLIFAVIPYTALAGHCGSDQPRPNRSTADPILSTVTHETAEAITDPLGTAWGDASGNEIADLCAGIYGRPIGGAGARAFNEAIGDGRYWLQELWSNATRHCQQRAPADAVILLVPPDGAVGVPLSVAATGSAPGRRPVAYRWDFGDGSAPVSGATVSHTFTAPGTYTVTVTMTDSWGDASAASAALTVS